MKKLLILTALGSALAGCGGKSSDPTEKYQSVVGKDVPTATRNSVTQQINDCGVAIDTDPTMEIVEGESGSHTVVLRGLYGQTRDSVSVVSTSNEEISKGAFRLNRVKSMNDGVEYTLSYSAPNGLIERDKDIRTFNVSLSPTSLLKIGSKCETKIGVVVKRTKSTASLSEIRYTRTAKFEKLSDQTIKVDVSASRTRASDLSLNVDYDSTATSGAKPVYDMSQAINRVSAASAAGGDKFRFVLKVDSEVLHMLVQRAMAQHPTERSFLMLATVSVINKITNVSTPAQNIVIEVTRDASEAEVAAEAAAAEKRAAAAAREQARKDAATAAAAPKATTTPAAATPVTAAPAKVATAAKPAAVAATPTPKASATPAATATAAPKATPTQAAPAAGAKK